MKLPQKDHFTFADLLARWNCSEKDLIHFICEGHLVPSVYRSGMLQPVSWDLDVDDDGDPAPIPMDTLDDGTPIDPVYFKGSLYLHGWRSGFNKMIWELLSDSREGGNFEANWYRVPIDCRPQNMVDLIFVPKEVVRVEGEHRIPTDSLKSVYAYFDEDDPFYSEEMDIAFMAWHAIRKGGKEDNIKAQYVTWLRSHYPDLVEAAIDRISTMCNPHKVGGRPKKLS